MGYHGSEHHCSSGKTLDSTLKYQRIVSRTKMKNIIELDEFYYNNKIINGQKCLT